MTYFSFEQIFESFNYPAGESHVSMKTNIDMGQSPVIEAKATGFDELCRIVTANRILEHNHIHATWFIPYFPFARHDRRIDRFDGVELHLAMELMSPLNLMIADPHSDVVGKLPNIPQHVAVKCFQEHGAFDEKPIVIIPDAGAAKKTYAWSKGFEVVQALKTRDPKTGKLSGFKVPHADFKGRPCVLIDDICDGGGTFLGLAQELAKSNAGPLTLGVTHGLFTKGLDSLSTAFHKIFTFDYQSPKLSPRKGLSTIAYKTLYSKGTYV